MWNNSRCWCIFWLNRTFKIGNTTKSSEMCHVWLQKTRAGEHGNHYEEAKAVTLCLVGTKR